MAIRAIADWMRWLGKLKANQSRAASPTLLWKWKWSKAGFWEGTWAKFGIGVCRGNSMVWGLEFQVRTCPPQGLLHRPPDRALFLRASRHLPFRLQLLKQPGATPEKRWFIVYQYTSAG